VWVILRSKPDLAASDPKSSAHEYRRYAMAMAKSVLVLAFGMNVTMLLAALVVWDVLPATMVWIVVGIVPTLATAGIVVAVAIRTGQSGHRLHAATTTESATTTDRDDDAYWIAGLIYRNSDDPALWVPKRFGGVGFTVNVARPAAWILIGAIVAITIGALIFAALA
jgi:uncharacterized membrane protein